MTQAEPIEHTVFTIERKLSTTPRHAFRFWSEAELKSRWNNCHPGWTVLEDTFDFRVAGTERKHWRTLEGQDQTFTAHYLDIIPDHRIIYAYEMSFAGIRLSASLVTILLTSSADKTRLVYTEQVAILDGGTDARQQRILGTEQGIDRLVSTIADKVTTR